MATAATPLVDAELSGQCEERHIAIYASGYAHLQASDSCDGSAEETSALRRISRTEIRDLSNTIERAKFDSLPEAIEPDKSTVRTEEEVLAIRVRRHGVAKRVSAFGLDRATDKEAAQRFQAVWVAVNRFFPKVEK